MRYSSLPIAVKAFISLFFGLALFAPLPFVVVMPGGATDVLDKVISIKSENAYKPTGSLYLLAVRVTSPGSAMFSAEILYGWANGDQRIFPRSVVYPDNVSAKVIDKEAKVDMTTSQDKAKALALAYMKKNYPQLPSVDPKLITLDVIDEKLIAAERVGVTVFLSPQANCREITSVPSTITVYSIRTIDDAVKALSANSSPEKLGMTCALRA